MALNVTWEPYTDPNITGFYDMMVYFNSTTNDMFGAGLMISLYVIMMLVFSRYGIKQAFSASSFIMFVLSAVLRATALISDVLVVFFAIATAVSIVMLADIK